MSKALSQIQRLLQLLESPVLWGLFSCPRVSKGQAKMGNLKWVPFSENVQTLNCLSKHPLAKRTGMLAETLPDWPASLLLFLPCHRYKGRWARRCLYHWSCSLWEKESAQGCSRALESLGRDPATITAWEGLLLTLWVCVMLNGKGISHLWDHFKLP